MLDIDKRFNAFEKGLQEKSTIYLNTEIANLLKNYPNWEFSGSYEPSPEGVAKFWIRLNDWTSPVSLGDTLVSYSKGLEITVELSSQKQDYRLIPSWSRKLSYNENFGDYCYYCGTFNGPQGELRLNHDCCHCMCN